MVYSCVCREGRNWIQQECPVSGGNTHMQAATKKCKQCGSTILHGIQHNKRLTSVSSMNLKTTSGAAAVPNTSVLILSLGFALWYRVACICLQISLADLVLLSKAVRRKKGTIKGRIQEGVRRENERRMSKANSNIQKCSHGNVFQSFMAAPQRKTLQKNDCTSRNLSSVELTVEFDVHRFHVSKQP